jgi:hypothetical protein
MNKDLAVGDIISHSVFNPQNYNLVVTSVVQSTVNYKKFLTIVAGGITIADYESAIVRSSQTVNGQQIWVQGQ